MLSDSETRKGKGAKRICFASANPHKIQEVSQLLSPLGYMTLGLRDLGEDIRIPETGVTLEENSSIKAWYVFDHYKVDCFADDTGLEVLSLNGEPGVRSARYAGEDGHPEKNINLLLADMDKMEDRRARFRTVITLIIDGQPRQFQGIVKGTILRERVGQGGFGYDPVFLPQGMKLTLAELSMDEKNAISHRGIAVRKLIDYLGTL